ncbi:Methyltransferase domain-containing protein [Streptomyces sp. DvalAA-14]|uniref:class I SAM-dependent methyltransferase n=1 Tax=Streptomyces sp. DvalAA-14 TaxID=1839759 RepID=UPI00081AF98E|nr:methyltransferase [Streptomyces sp. SID4948]SCE37408.1 Methyltransferase domain-containing protein [Streptomyces sp. DvalAA-14]
MATDSAEETQPYEVTAEFYDILQENEVRRRAKDCFAPAARRARIGILDVGAGTGVVTDVLLEHSAVPVHAVEPARAMRAVLLSRLASAPAGDRARATVHPFILSECALTNVADLVVCSNVVGCLDPAERRATWRAMVEALTPGGLAIVDPPPRRLPLHAENRELPKIRLGRDVYSASVCSEPEGEVIRSTFTYRVERGGVIVRTKGESFLLWPASREEIAAEFMDAGLMPISSPPSTPALMYGRRMSGR